MFISFGVLAVVCVAPTLLYFHSSMGGIAARDVQARARRDMGTLLWLLQQERFETADLLDTWLKGAGSHFGFRITYMERGRVLADSEVSQERIPLLEDHSTRPEVREAEAAGESFSMRHSTTLGEELLYVGKAVTPGLLQYPGVLRLAVPLAQVQAQQERLLKAINWLIPLSLAVMLLLGLWLSRSLAASISDFSRTASAIGNGDYTRRLQAPPGREFVPLQESVNTMAAQIQSTIQGLEEQQGQWEALYNGLAEGVLLLDAGGAVESWNHAFARVFREASLRRGVQLLEVTMEPALHQAARQLVQAGAPPAQGPTTISLQRGDKEYEVSLTPFRDAKAVRKLVLVFRDVTEARRLERVRRDFVANASHEMRTPLTTIAGYAETLLEQDRLDEAMARRFLGVIHKAAWRMAGFVQSMMTLSRIEAGAWVPVATPILVQPLLEELLQDLEPKATKHNVHVAAQLDEEEMEIVADEEGLATVLRNLLENAVRYSPAGGQVLVEAEVTGEGRRFAVSDEGPGVPPELRGRIFERFFRAADQGGRRSGGAGLGLAICKHMVQSMGGRIWVEGPRHGGPQGATFVVELPQAPHRAGNGQAGVPDDASRATVAASPGAAPS
ncbi:ATP-binding protein [Megalodesulfovibrio paquesii]